MHLFSLTYLIINSILLVLLLYIFGIGICFTICVTNLIFLINSPVSLNCPIDNLGIF